MWPSQRHRISMVFKKSRTRWHQDGKTILTKTVLIFPGVAWTYKKMKNQHPHNIFLRSLKWNTVKSWCISKEKKTIRKKKAVALLLYMQLEHDHLLQVFGLFITLSFNLVLSRPGFLSRRVVPIAEFDKRAF